MSATRPASAPRTPVQGPSLLLLLALSLALLLPLQALAAPYSLVLSDGSLIQLKERPRWAFGRVRGVRLDGGRLNLADGLVDRPRSRAANGEAHAESAHRFDQAELARARTQGGTAPLPPLLERPAVPDWPSTAPTRHQEGSIVLAAPLPRGKRDTEQQWRTEAVGLKQEIAWLKYHLRRLEAEAKAWGALHVASLENGTRSYEGAIASRLGEIRRARHEAERRLPQAKGELVRLEEAARKASVPPGWLRPEP